MTARSQCTLHAVGLWGYRYAHSAVFAFENKAQEPMTMKTIVCFFLAALLGVVDANAAMRHSNASVAPAIVADTEIQVLLPAPRSAAFSSSAYKTFDAFLAVDDDPTTHWLSGAAGKSWIEIDLGRWVRLSKIELLAVDSGGEIQTHSILVGPTKGGLANKKTFTAAYGNFEQLKYESPSPVANVRFVRIETQSGGVWAGWKEIRVYEKRLTAQLNWPKYFGYYANASYGSFKNANSILNDIVNVKNMPINASWIATEEPLRIDNAAGYGVEHVVLDVQYVFFCNGNEVSAYWEKKSGGTPATPPCLPFNVKFLEAHSHGGVGNPGFILRGDYRKRWNDYANSLSTRADKVAMFHLADEPISKILLADSLSLDQRKTLIAHVRQALAENVIPDVKTRFQGVPVGIVFNAIEMGKGAVTGVEYPDDYAFTIPQGIDWVSFDCYGPFNNCKGTEVAKLHQALVERLVSAKQRIFLIPDASSHLKPGYSDALIDYTVRSRADAYYALALQPGSRVIGVFPFIWQDYPSDNVKGLNGYPGSKAKYRDIGCRFIAFSQQNFAQECP